MSDTVRHKCPALNVNLMHLACIREVNKDENRNCVGNRSPPYVPLLSSTLFICFWHGQKPGSDPLLYADNMSRKES